MTARAFLWTYKPRKDGKCNIKVYVHKGGKKQYRSTEYFVRPEEWDRSLNRVKRTVPFASKINAHLARLEEEARGEMIGVTNSLLKLIEGFIEDCQAGKTNLKYNTWKQYIYHLNHLRGFCLQHEKTDLSFADIDLVFYGQFCAYLRENGCKEPGVGNHIKYLKKFMRLGLERKLHQNTAFQAKAFHAAKPKPQDKIFLTTDEIEAIANLNLTSRPGLQKERDRFLVSYYMVLRYGDSIRISRANIIEHNGTTYYKNTAEKTGTVSFIPVKPAALNIIRAHNYDLSGDTNQEANRKLKVIAAMAGITDDMSGPGEGYFPKSALVTTHTARRSAATNLLLSGVPLSEIMQLGGWKYEATLKQYLLAGGIRLAELSAGREFFR
jgi:integrase